MQEEEEGPMLHLDYDHEANEEGGHHRAYGVRLGLEDGSILVVYQEENGERRLRSAFPEAQDDDSTDQPRQAQDLPLALSQTHYQPHAPRRSR
jgi:hypothetical protein